MTTNLEYAVNESIVVDIAPYIEAHAPNYARHFFSDDTYVKQATTDQGYIPAVYQLNDVAANEGINKSGPAIRSDWLEQSGLELPATYDEYHEVLVAFQQFCDHPFWLPYTGGYFGAMFSGGFGVSAEISSSRSFIQEDGKVVSAPPRIDS